VRLCDNAKNMQDNVPGPEIPPFDTQTCYLSRGLLFQYAAHVQ
jgi:hypothetical protein